MFCKEALTGSIPGRASSAPAGTELCRIQHVSPRFIRGRALDLSRMRTVERRFFVDMYYSSPILLAKSNMEKANFCQVSNVVCDGSKLRIYMVKMGKWGNKKNVPILNKHAPNACIRVGCVLASRSKKV